MYRGSKIFKIFYSNLVPPYHSQRKSDLGQNHSCYILLGFCWKTMDLSLCLFFSSQFLNGSIILNYLHKQNKYLFIYYNGRKRNKVRWGFPYKNIERENLQKNKPVKKKYCLKLKCFLLSGNEYLDQSFHKATGGKQPNRY